MGVASPSPRYGSLFRLVRLSVFLEDVGSRQGVRVQGDGRGRARASGVGGPRPVPRRYRAAPAPSMTIGRSLNGKPDRNCKRRSRCRGLNHANWWSRRSRRRTGPRASAISAMAAFFDSTLRPPCAGIEHPVSAQVNRLLRGACCSSGFAAPAHVAISHAPSTRPKTREGASGKDKAPPNLPALRDAAKRVSGHADALTKIKRVLRASGALAGEDAKNTARFKRLALDELNRPTRENSSELPPANRAVWRPEIRPHHDSHAPSPSCTRSATAYLRIPPSATGVVSTC